MEVGPRKTYFDIRNIDLSNSRLYVTEHIRDKTTSSLPEHGNQIMALQPQEEETETGCLESFIQTTKNSNSIVIVYNSGCDPRELYEEDQYVSVPERTLCISDTDLKPEFQVHKACVRTDLLGRLRAGGCCCGCEVGGNDGRVGSGIIGAKGGGGESRCNSEGLLLAVTSCDILGSPLEDTESTVVDSESGTHNDPRTVSSSCFLTGTDDKELHDFKPRQWSALPRSGLFVTPSSVARASSCPLTCRGISLTPTPATAAAAAAAAAAFAAERRFLAASSCDVQCALKQEVQNLPTSHPEGEEIAAQEVIDILRPRAYSADVPRHVIVPQPRRLFPLSQSQQVSLDAPLIVPCFHGRELDMSPEMAMTGLSAIAVKPPANKPPTPSVIQYEHAALCERNSFWNLHRPELSKLPWTADASAREVLDFLRMHSTGMEEHDERDAAVILDPAVALVNRAGAQQDDAMRVILAERASVAEEELEMSELKIKVRSLQLSDEDLPPEVRLHRSGGELCVVDYSLAPSDPGPGPGPDSDSSCSLLQPATDSTEPEDAAVVQSVDRPHFRTRARDDREEEVVIREFLPQSSWEADLLEAGVNAGFKKFCTDVISNKC